MFKANNNKIVEVSSKANRIVVNLSNLLKKNKSKNSTHVLNIGATKKPAFLTPNGKNVFNHL